MKFLKNSLREFRHVVWPTREETKKYFWIVLVVLTLFWIYLFLVWNIFSEILFWAKEVINPGSSTPTADQVVLPEGVTFETEDGESITVDANEVPAIDAEASIEDTEVVEVVPTQEETTPVE